jgi:histidyl-tRNA synthetase
MTRGRKREHYQWDAEILGEPGVAAEAELLAAIFAFLERVGLGAGEVRVRVNSRALLEESLRATVLRDRPEAFAPLCIIIDKLGKIGRDAVLEQLCEPAGDLALTREAAVEVVDRLSIDDLEEALREAPPASVAAQELRRLFELLDAYGLSSWVRFDASVVRGLAYYTGIVFEGFDADATLRAVFGGGRYDRLVETLGGPPMPAVGFGFGDVVIAELLSDQGRLPALKREVADVVLALDESLRPAALRVARGLRGEGRSVEVVLGPARPKRVLAEASKSGVERVFLLGPEEAARGKMSVRVLTTREESEADLPGP